MHIEDFKTWHWIVIGPIVGILYGCMILWRGPSADMPNVDTLDQGRFEREAAGITGRTRFERLLPRYAAGKPWLKNIVVHPPLQGDPTRTYWVTGQVYSADLERENEKDPASKLVVHGNWAPFRYPARSPYRAVLGAPGAYDDITGYFHALQQKSPATTPKFRYAWWDNSALTLILPALAGLSIIGIAWPMTIHVMQGAGLARPPQRIKLPKSRPAPVKVAVDHTAGEEQLAVLNARLEQELAAVATASSTAVETPAEEGAVKALTAGPAADAAAEAEKERQIREYGGEFYPVVRTVHKEGETPEESKDKAK